MIAKLFINYVGSNPMIVAHELTYNFRPTQFCGCMANQVARIFDVCGFIAQVPHSLFIHCCYYSDA